MHRRAAERGYHFCKRKPFKKKKTAEDTVCRQRSGKDLKNVFFKNLQVCPCLWYPKKSEKNPRDLFTRGFMITITSRNNACIRHFRKLASDRDYRTDCGEYVCDGAKMLEEAILAGMKISTVLWKETVLLPDVEAQQQFLLPPDLFDYVSSMKNSPGPLFAVRIPSRSGEERIRNAIVLENVQDPGNVGTVIRTASAFQFDSVVLVGACADCYHPKTVRATMGAIFRQRIDVLSLQELKDFLDSHSLSLCGAELSEDASDIRGICFEKTAVAVGSEGHGLSTELLGMCDRRVIIPMDPHSESLNAAVASAVIMWEVKRQNL